MASENRLCLISGSGEEIAGYLVGYVKEESTLRPVKVAELESMYVQEEYRRRSVGARLVGKFLEWAGDQGAERASVTAYAANERALSFYRREGFGDKSISLEIELRRSIRR